MTSTGADPGGDWTPAFAGQRPPFPVVHGSYSPKIIGRRAKAVHRALSKAMPGVVQSWPLLLSELATVMARLEVLRTALDDVGVTGKGADTLLKHIATAERQHLKLIEALGQSPSSYARTARDLASAEVLAHDLPGLRDAGRQWVPAHVLRGEVEQDDGPGGER